jgi:hypothetical protein
MAILVYQRINKPPFIDDFPNVEDFSLYIWLVVWNMAFIFPNSWDDDPVCRTPSFFRGVENTN